MDKIRTENEGVQTYKKDGDKKGRTVSGRSDTQQIEPEDMTQAGQYAPPKKDKEQSWDTRGRLRKAVIAERKKIRKGNKEE